MKALGHIFKYGDNVDTDVIIPARYLNSFDAQELASHAMADIDPEFVNKVQPGDLFFCISGAESDGHTYAEDVAAKGAAVIVVEKPVNVPDTVTVIRVKSTRYAMGKISSAFYGNPSEKLTVIGLTGTKGNTTPTYMIRELL